MLSSKKSQFYQLSYWVSYGKLACLYMWKRFLQVYSQAWKLTCLSLKIIGLYRINNLLDHLDMTTSSYLLDD